MLEPLTVRIKLVCRAVEGDGSFAGAGASLHHERAAGFVADDAVLFGLDCRDDIAHTARAFRGDRRQECPFSLETRMVLI